jgi:hypothetical protein
MGLGNWISHGYVHSQFRYVFNDSILVILPSLSPRRYMTETDELCLLVAELVSAYPTAGGMYFVTKHVVPKEHVAIWAWIIGWCNFLGQAAGVASLSYSIAQMVLAAVVMNTDIVDGESSFKPYVYSPQ